MINIKDTVEKYYPKILELGFKTDDTKEKVIESLERMPKDMFPMFEADVM